MRKASVLAAGLCMFLSALAGADEKLNYTLNWPSGLGLGEATLGQSAGDPRQFSLLLQAAFPGFPVRDHFVARATSDWCSLELTKDSTHGTRRAEETSTFDRTRGVVVRQTAKGGGKSEIPIEPCAKDALTFLQFVRREIGAGRIPPPQKIYFGAPYDITIRPAGTQRIPIGEEQREADKLAVEVKGPASKISLEIFIGKDAERTPLLVRLPLPAGAFTMELVP